MHDIILSLGLDCMKCQLALLSFHWDDTVY